MKDTTRFLTAIATVTTLLTCSVSRAEDFITGPHWVGSQCLPADILSLAAGDHALYASCADGQLYALDLADPDHPQVAGVVALPEPRQQILLRYGGFLYLASGSALSYVDVRDPLHPRLVGAYPEPIDVRELAMDNGFAAACATSPGRLIFLDAADPANLVAIDQLDVPAEHVAIAGNVVVYSETQYADGVTQSVLYSVLREDPTHPRVCGNADDQRQWSSSVLEGMDVAGVLITKWYYDYSTWESANIVTPWRNYIKTYDIGPDGTLTQRDRMRLDYETWGEVAGRFTPGSEGRIVIPFSDGAVSVLDIAGPSPVIDGWTRSGEPMSQAVHALDRIYGCSDDILHVLAVGELPRSLCRGSEPFFQDAALDGERRVTTSEVNVRPGGNWLYVYEMSVAGDWSRIVMNYNVPSDYRFGEVDLDADLVVVNGEPTYTLDLGSSTPERMHEQATSFTDFTVVAPGVGAAASADGLLVVDLSDPTALAVISTLPGDPLERIEHVDGYRSFAAGVSTSGKVQIFDLTHAESPVVCARFGEDVRRAVPVEGAPLPTLAVTRQHWGRCAFTRLDLYDLAAPTAPRLLGGLDVPGLVEDARQVGTRLYLACGRGGIVVLDIVDPTQPIMVGGLAANDAQALALDGNDLLVADEDDIERLTLDHDTPVEFALAEFRGIGTTGRVALSWHTAISPSTAEFRVHRVVPTAPDFLPATRTADGWQAVDTLPAAYSARTATYELQARLAPAQAWFAAATTTVTLDLPAASRLVAATPNPFNPQTVVRYELGVAATYAIRIHDARGRCVRHLAAGVATPGLAEIPWDGRDDAGRALPTGTYLARLVTDTSASSLKLTLVR